MGPSAFGAAGIVQALRDLGHEVVDEDNISPPSPPITHANSAIKALPQIAAWTQAIGRRPAVRVSSAAFLCPSSLFKSRRVLALAMFVFVFEALCVLGRVPGPVEFHMAIADVAFVLVERPKGRTA